MRARKDRAPNGMRVQDSASIHASRDSEMQQGLRGRAAITAHDVGRFVHLQKLLRRKAPLIQSRRSNCQAQRLAGNYRAEVSARAQDPASRVEALSNLHQVCNSVRISATIGPCRTNTSSGGQWPGSGFSSLHVRDYSKPGLWSAVSFLLISVNRK